MQCLNTVRKIFSFFPVWIAAMTLVACAAPPPGYTLSWSDEFNGSKLDRTNVRYYAPHFQNE